MPTRCDRLSRTLHPGQSVGWSHWAGPRPSHAERIDAHTSASWSTTGSRSGRRAGHSAYRRFVLQPDQAGRFASMASTTSGASGSIIGRNRCTHLARGRDEELLEVPLDVAGLALGVGMGHQLLVERVAILAVDLDLLEHREGHAVGRRAEGGDLLGTARLLGPELVAGEAKHAEPTVPVRGLEALQPLVLGGEPALRGDVHDEQRLALVVGQGRPASRRGRGFPGRRCSSPHPRGRLRHGQSPPGACARSRSGPGWSKMDVGRGWSRGGSGAEGLNDKR